MHSIDRPISSIVKTRLFVREVRGSNPRPVKSDTVSPTDCHRFDVSTELCCSGTGAVATGRLLGAKPPRIYFSPPKAIYVEMMTVYKPNGL